MGWSRWGSRAPAKEKPRRRARSEAPGRDQPGLAVVGAVQAGVGDVAQQDGGAVPAPADGGDELRIAGDRVGLAGLGADRGPEGQAVVHALVAQADEADPHILG